MILTFDNIPMDTKRCFSICDMRIDEILYSDNSVRFCFYNGLQRFENDELIRTKTAFIEFGGCNADDFTCHVFKQSATKKGAELYGVPFSLEEIGNMLATNERKIEVYLELYDFNFVYWRGVLLPCNSNGLSDRIDIEISGQVSVTIFCG